MHGLRQEALAQTPPKVARVGWISEHSANPAVGDHLAWLRAGLRERGWVEGRNLLLEARWGERDNAQQLTAELVRAKVDVLVSHGRMAFGVAAASGAVPLVFLIAGDPVDAKLVASLARPDANRTGVTLLGYELIAKRLEFLKEAVPGVQHVAFLINKRHPGAQTELQEARAAAARLGLTLQHVPVATLADMEGAYEAITRERADAVMTSIDSLMTSQARNIAEFSSRRRVPVISGWAEFALVGNLMTYGPSFKGSYAYLATYVDKILRGAKAADLPVELPPKLELVINLKTAKALGITIPQSVLLRADEVIQ
jgi:putative ABC transport system substrate-binding protein